MMLLLRRRSVLMRSTCTCIRWRQSVSLKLSPLARGLKRMPKTVALKARFIPTALAA